MNVKVKLILFLSLALGIAYISMHTYPRKALPAVVDDACKELEDKGLYDKVAGLGYDDQRIQLSFYGKADPEVVKIVKAVIDREAPLGTPLEIVENVTVSVLSPKPTEKEKQSLPPVFKDVYQPGTANASPVTVVVGCSLPEFPTEVTVYRVLKPKVDDVYAANMAQQLGFEGDPVPLNRGGTREVYTYTNETHMLEIGLDGSILLAKNTNLQLPRSLPTEQDCIAIAKRWLTAHNMYSENVVEVETKPYLTVDGNPLTIGVTFKVALGGYEEHGLGIFVAVGESGEIVRVSRSLPQSEAYGSVKLKAVDAALGILKYYLTSPLPAPPENLECIINMRAFTQLTVQNITLQYFNNAGYLQPVYVFEGEAYDKYSPKVESFVGLVDAVDRTV